MTRSRRWWPLALAALGTTRGDGGGAAAAGGGGGQEAGIDLAAFQRILRTGLDGELAKIVDGHFRAPSRAAAAPLPADAARARHAKRSAPARVRGRRVAEEDDGPRDRSGSAATTRTAPDADTSGPAYFTERAWEDLVAFAWRTAGALRRDARRLAVTSDPEDAGRGPFLACLRGRRRRDRGGGGVGAHDAVLAAFGASRDDSLLLSASRDETCLVLTTTAATARRAAAVGRGDGETGGTALAVVPLVDVAKIRVGTVDEVSSRAWSVPAAPPGDMTTSEAAAASNATEALDLWERALVVDLVPGVGGMREEATLLEAVNRMMSDIQDMGEVGWLRRRRAATRGDAEEEDVLVEESLVGVPSLSDVFSLTSSLRDVVDVDGNARVAFWRDAFRDGLEAWHLCGEMFATLYVKPRPGYHGFDLVMNPLDGPPPGDLESSASNPACVTSLIAALATHPSVLAVEAHYPSELGWRVAQRLDAAER